MSSSFVAGRFFTLVSQYSFKHDLRDDQKTKAKLSVEDVKPKNRTQRGWFMWGQKSRKERKSDGDDYKSYGDSEMSQAVNHPKHYTFGTIEVIEALEDWGLNFHRSSAVKYIVRAGKKDPDKEIEDLEKAIWYLKRNIEWMRKQEVKKPQIQSLIQSS